MQGVEHPVDPVQGIGVHATQQEDEPFIVVDGDGGQLEIFEAVAGIAAEDGCIATIGLI